MAADPIFVDTNVLTRATFLSAPLHEEANAALQQLWQAKTELWISRQVIREYIANATRSQSYSQPILPELVTAQVQRFQKQFRVAEDNAHVTEELLKLLNNIPMGGKQVHDANIVATMLAYGIKTLLTHNVTDFARFSAHITVLPLEPMEDI